MEKNQFEFEVSALSETLAQELEGRRLSLVMASLLSLLASSVMVADDESEADELMSRIRLSIGSIEELVKKRAAEGWLGVAVTQ